MEAAGERAAFAVCDAPSRSMAIRVDLPFEQEVNPFVGEAYEHRSFFSRLPHFALSILRDDLSRVGYYLQ